MVLAFAGSGVPGISAGMPLGPATIFNDSQQDQKKGLIQASGFLIKFQCSQQR